MVEKNKLSTTPFGTPCTTVYIPEVLEFLLLGLLVHPLLHLGRLATTTGDTAEAGVVYDRGHVGRQYFS